MNPDVDHLITNPSRTPFTWILHAIVILVLAIGTLATVAGYADLCVANGVVKDVSFDMQRIVHSNASYKNPLTAAQIQADFARLEAKSRSALDPNAIAFLFQVLSLALVSGGAWLLHTSSESAANARASAERANGLASEAKDKATNAAVVVAALPPIVLNFSYSVTIGGYFGQAILLSTLLSESSPNAPIATYQTLLRETSRPALEALRRAAASTYGHSQSQQVFLVDCAGTVMERLAAAISRDVQNVGSLMTDWNDIMTILNTVDFVARYEAQMSALGFSESR